MPGEFDVLEQMIEEAPEAGFAAVNYGKLTVKMSGISWVDRKPIRRELKKGERVNPGETLELEFTVHISELNPALEFEYTRNTSIRKSGRVLSDWQEVVEPSLKATFGDKYVEKLFKEPYVCVEDVDNVTGNTSKKTGKLLGVPKFLAVYADKAACQKARDERFGASGTTAAAPAQATATTLTPEIVGQTKALIQSVGVDMARSMLAEKKPFGDFDADTLVSAAQAA